MSTLDYATARPATQCEYRLDTIGGFFRSFNIERRVERLLNHRASDGWDLIDMHRTYFNRYTLIFRRKHTV